MKKIMLIDGNNIMFRAFYAIPLLTNKKGEYTNAIFGFMNMLFKFIADENPTHVAVAFDLPTPTFRSKKFPEYKGTRKPTPDELRPQIPILKNLIKTMNIKIYELDGFEADDLLGTLAKTAANNGFEVTIVSGDKDLLQIASDKIKILMPKSVKGVNATESFYESDVFEKYGVTPTEFIDVKALMGDASDNIPGVPSIGEKTALKIISEYKSIENAMENAENIKPKKAGINIIEYRDLAVLSKELVTIEVNAPVDFNENEVEYFSEKTFNITAFDEFVNFGFNRLLKNFAFSETKKTTIVEKVLNIKTLQTEKEIKDFLVKLTKLKQIFYRIIYFDNVGLGISFKIDEQYFFASNVNYSEKDFFGFFKPLFESENEKITLDIKKDIGYLRSFDISLQNAVFDVMIGGYLLNASLKKYDYDDLATDLLEKDASSYESFFGKGKEKLQLQFGQDDKLPEFACRELEIISELFEIETEKLAENEMLKLYNEIEHPLIYVLADMEKYGVKIDENALIEYGKNLDLLIADLVTNIYDLAGEQFNINSPKQMGVILFEKLNLPYGKKTKTGYSTSIDVLKNLESEHEIIKYVIEYRTLSKLKSTYVDGLLASVNPFTGKIHTTFNQTITTTGRISSTEPNLQNIPIRMEIGREIRKIFIPEDDSFLFADADYSQIELRVLAHISADETFINAFNNDQDIHKITASQVFKIPLEEVNNDQRSDAKAVNFGIVYGISAFSLSTDLGITVQSAKRYIESYFDRYPRVKEYLDNTIIQAKKDGFASTMLNRKRYIPELASSNFNERSFGERVAMNMPIQGTAADIIKIAMINVHNALKRNGLQSRLVLQVHDELLIEMKKTESDQVMEIVKNEMENALKLDVKLEVDINKGENWFVAH